MAHTIIWKRSKKDNRGGNKSPDKSCHNNGSCSWCESNRTNKGEKRAKEAELKIKEHNAGIV